MATLIHEVRVICGKENKCFQEVNNKLLNNNIDIKISINDSGRLLFHNKLCDIRTEANIKTIVKALLKISAECELSFSGCIIYSTYCGCGDPNDIHGIIYLYEGEAVSYVFDIDNSNIGEFISHSPNISTITL